MYFLGWRWITVPVYDLDKPGKEVNELSEHEGSISPLLFEDSPPDLQSPGNPSQVNFEEPNNPQIHQNSIVFGTSAEEVVKEIRFRIEQKTTLTASAGTWKDIGGSKNFQTS